MKEYHKIQTVFFRDPANNHKTLLDWEYAKPEFKYLQASKWIWTEKVDGTNIRVMISDTGDIRFGGKTDNAQIPAKLIAHLNDTFLPMRDRLVDIFPDGGCLYGEGYGAGIKKGGGAYLSEQGFVMFDVSVGNWWLKRESVEDVASKLSVPIVPIVGTGSLVSMVGFVMRGFDSQWGDFLAEGVVARPAVELFTRSGERIITKLKYKDFAHATI